MDFATTSINLAIQSQERRLTRDSKKWQKKVLSFVQKEGHCRIPQNYEEDASLGNWVKNRRSEKKKGTLDKKKVERFKKSNWVFVGGKR